MSLDEDLWQGRELTKKQTIPCLLFYHSRLKRRTNFVNWPVVWQKYEPTCACMRGQVELRLIY